MKKKIIIYIIIITFTVLLAFAVNHIMNSNVKEKIEIAEKVTDECTEEYEEMINEKSKVANTKTEKISPNADFILRKVYSKCNHTIEENIELPQELVNKSIDELKEEYSEWEVEEFSSEKIVLSRNYDEQCGQHYILRNDDGMIAIYEIDNNGNEILLEKTEIATEYLTESDLANIQEGIRVNGREELNKMLEDFE